NSIEMNRISLTFLFLVLIIPSGAQNSFLKKYSGAYNVMVTGYLGEAAEAYGLADDGGAVWVYGYKDASGKMQTRQKRGSWTAREGEITIIINGNTGKITEVYRWRNNKFVNTEDSSRWLKKRTG